MAGDGGSDRPRSYIPDFHFAFARRQTAGGGEDFAVRENATARTASDTAGERCDCFFALRVYETRFFISAERDRRAVGRPRQRIDLACGAARATAREGPIGAQRISLVVEQKFFAGQHRPHHVFQRLPMRVPPRLFGAFFEHVSSRAQP